MPIYKHKDENGNIFEIGPIEGATSKKFPGPSTKDAKDAITVHDILGAMTGTRGLGVWEGMYKR
jgi:hypothetical protein